MRRSCDFTLSSITNGNARGNNRRVREETSAATSKFDFRTICSVGGCACNTAFAMSRPTCTPRLSGARRWNLTVVNRTYDAGCSANVAFDITTDFGSAWPRLGWIAGRSSATCRPADRSTRPATTITTGNPLLDPFRATTLDASLEWYFARNR